MFICLFIFTQTTTTIGANGERITKSVSSKRGADGEEERKARIEHTDASGKKRSKSASSKAREKDRKRKREAQKEIPWDGGLL